MADKIAYIDFCNTITNVHTLVPFIKYLSSKKGLVGKIRYYSIQLYRKIIKRNDANSIFLHFDNLDENFVKSAARDFYDIIVSKNLNPNVVKMIQELDNNGYKIVIISNAIPEYIYHLNNLFRIEHIISNQMEIADGKYRSKLRSDNRIYAAKKVEAIRKYENEMGIQMPFRLAMSDHISDIPMLELADKAIVVNPNSKEFCDIAKQRNWEIIIDK